MVGHAHIPAGPLSALIFFVFLRRLAMLFIFQNGGGKRKMSPRVCCTTQKIPSVLHDHVTLITKLLSLFDQFAERERIFFFPVKLISFSQNQ